jgi:hypothetical protein
VIARPVLGSLLAALLVAAAGQAAIQPPRPAQDVLILRSGEHRTGALKSCVADTCYLDGRATALALIAWIGLAPPSPQAPALQDPAAAEDEVHRRDGTVVRGHLVGISLGDVLLREGDLDRRSVAWIHLRGAPAESPPGAIVVPPAEAGGPGKGQTKGALWQGKVRARMIGKTGDATTQWDIQAQVRLREYRTPLRDPRTGKTIGTFIDLEHEGTEVKEDFHQIVPGAGSSSGSGSQTLTTLPGQAHASHPSAIYLKSADVDTTAAVGFDIPAHGGRYFAGVPEGTGEYEVRGSFNGQEVSEMHRFLPVTFGRLPVGPHFLWNEDPQLRSLSADGVMMGSYTAQDAEKGISLRVTWAICREGVKCVEPPDPGPEAP